MCSPWIADNNAKSHTTATVTIFASFAEFQHPIAQLVPLYRAGRRRTSNRGRCGFRRIYFDPARTETNTLRG